MGAANAAPAVHSPAFTEVLALTECIISGVRRFPQEWFTIPTERVDAMTSGGLCLSRAQIDALWATHRDRILTPDGITSHYTPAAPTADALRVLQLTHYDPGSAVYRYHSAANTVPGVVSAFVRYGHSNPHSDLRQWDGDTDAATVQALAMTADVIHCHMDYRTLLHDLRRGREPGQRIAITYHGSVLPGDTQKVLMYPEDDQRLGSVVFGARPYHRRWGSHITWLPIPMPIADYAPLSAGHRRGKTYRVAHSPTNRALKGTTVFLQAIEYLRNQESINIEAVLIEGLPHGEAMRLKATCDATFDSFFLGMQGSGLEAAAMGQAVIAGDPAAQNDLIALGIAVPWTIANDSEGLRTALRRLATDATFARSEAERVGQYVRTHHSYEAVGAKYRDTLTEALRGTPNG